MIAMLIQLTPWRGGSTALAGTTKWTNGAGDTSWTPPATGAPASPALRPTRSSSPRFPAQPVSLNGGDVANSLTFTDAYSLNNGDLTLDVRARHRRATFTATVNSILTGGPLTLASDNGLTGADAVAGGGTLFLTAGNTYTGGTTVNKGTLVFNNFGGAGERRRDGQRGRHAGDPHGRRSNILNNIILNGARSSTPTPGSQPRRRPDDEPDRRSTVTNVSRHDREDSSSAATSSSAIRAVALTKTGAGPSARRWRRAASRGRSS